MTTAVQRRRGTNTEHASFTGLEGEISVNTTNESVHVHDGSTAGGFELMRADGANSTVSLGDITGVTAGTGLSGGGTTGTVTLDIDGTVATLAGTQTFTNKTLTSPILNTPTIGTSFTIGGATITEAELEILDGATVTTTELNYVDGVTSAIQTQIDAKAPLASPSFTGNVSVGGTVDGRDVAADGTKLDGIEASADVTDTANVTAAGAVMDSELTSEASVKALNQGVATTDSPAFAGLTVDTTTLAVDSTNNRVGIGEAAPETPLHVKSADNAVVLVESTDTKATTSFMDDTTTNNFGVAIGCIGDDLILQAGTTASVDMTIKADGNVGIGTASPSQKLEVAGNVVLDASNAELNLKSGITGTSGAINWTFNTESTEFAAIKLPYDTRTTTGLHIDSGYPITIDNSGYTVFAKSGVEQMRIDSSGNVLVGTTTAPATLAASTNSSDTGMSVNHHGRATFASNNTYIMTLNRYSSHGAVLRFAKDGVLTGSISTNGSSLPSDRNFKKNISDLALGLDFVNSLNPKTYNFNIDDEGQPVMTGLIAQEVEAALTAAGVERNSMTLLQYEPTENVNDSDYQMDYVKFVPILINSIKEQQTLIESLTDRIAALEA